jgi:hypothetical protein
VKGEDDSELVMSDSETNSHYQGEYAEEEFQYQSYGDVGAGP